jgi:hypothetical protein
MSRHTKGIGAGNTAILSLRRSAARLPPRQILKETVAASKKKPSEAVAMISVAHDEKLALQAIAGTTPDLPPEPGVRTTFRSRS